MKEEIRRILIQMGENPDRKGLKTTPIRVERLYNNLFYGYRKKLVVMDEECRNNNIFDDDVIPITIFENEESFDHMAKRRVKFHSFCEHHMVLFFGYAYIAYIPKKNILGMNKIDKVVKYFGARLQIQERMGNQIATWINTNINPKGVAVTINARHLCAELQGDDGIFETTALRGVFRKKARPVQEFLTFVNEKRNGD